MNGRASDGELLRKAEKYEEIYNELVELRKREATTADRNQKLEAQVGRLKTAHETAERQRTALIQEREHYKKANAEVRDEVAKLTKRLRECEHIRGDLEATQKQLGELSLELNHLRMAYDDKKALLDTRTLELHEMRAFVDKSDAVSCGDVQRMLEHLNEQIFQLAALVTDGTPFGDSPRNDRDVRAVYAKVERWLGRPTADMLSRNLHADDPSLAQIGLQAVASELAAWIICAWDVNLDDPLNSLLTNIHEAIYDASRAPGYLCPVAYSRASLRKGVGAIARRRRRRNLSSSRLLALRAPPLQRSRDHRQEGLGRPVRGQGPRHRSPVYDCPEGDRRGCRVDRLSACVPSGRHAVQCHGNAGRQRVRSGQVEK